MSNNQNNQLPTTIGDIDIPSLFANFDTYKYPEIVYLENMPPGVKYYYKYSPDTDFYDIKGNLKPKTGESRLIPYFSCANIEEKRAYLNWRNADKKAKKAAKKANK